VLLVTTRLEKKGCRFRDASPFRKKERRRFGGGKTPRSRGGRTPLSCKKGGAIPSSANSRAFEKKVALELREAGKREPNVLLHTKVELTQVERKKEGISSFHRVGRSVGGKRLGTERGS